MSDVIIFGTIGLDSITTPFGQTTDSPGGTALFAAYSASLFVDVGVASVVGEDFPKEEFDCLRKKNINVEGIEKLPGKTFKWHAMYEFDMNEAKTLHTELNVIEQYSVVLPEDYQHAQWLLLANNHPAQQIEVLQRMESNPFVVLDTMNFWIEHNKEEVLKIMKEVDVVVVNDAEARMLFTVTNLITAGKKILELGPKYVVIKKGEHGALLLSNCKNEIRIFNAPGYPLENVIDPTGAGDSFAGALIGYLSQQDQVTEEVMRRAVIKGSVVASYNAEGLGLQQLKNLSTEDVQKRYKEFETLREF